MASPYDPDWRPRYTGPDEQLGDVGSGAGFGVSLYHLYYAGRERLPQISVLYSDMTAQVHQTHGASRSEFTRSSGGFHPAHTLWMELRDELQVILRKSAINFWDVGEALVDTADDYARTDDEAADAFAGRLDKAEDGVFPITALPPEPTPPAPGDDQPPPPRYREGAGTPATPHYPPPPGEGPGERNRSSLERPWEEDPDE